MFFPKLRNIKINKYTNGAEMLRLLCTDTVLTLRSEKSPLLKRGGCHFFSINSIPYKIVSVRFKPSLSEHFFIRSDSLWVILRCKLTSLGSADFMGLPIFLLPFSLIIITTFLDKSGRTWYYIKGIRRWQIPPDFCCGKLCYFSRASIFVEMIFSLEAFV